MIPAPRGLVARYKQTLTDNQGKTRTYYDEETVIAFDDDGEALVLDDGNGCLVPAAGRRRNFHNVGQATSPDLVALIPAAGWRVKWKHGHETWTSPLVGWGLRADGSVVALDTDPNGIVTELDHHSEDWQVYHPDGPPLAEETR